MKKTMLEVLQERLVEGLAIISVKETTTRYHVEFWHGGSCVQGSVLKSCAPGCHEEVADFAIFSAMAQICMNRGDREQAKEWLKKI